MLAKCNYCRNEFKTYLSRIKIGKGRFCSKQCSNKDLLGKPTWNKGTKGLCKPNSGSFKTGQLPWNWQGDNPGYFALHEWIGRKLGKPLKCQKCGIDNTKLYWANKSHKYSRELNDWLSLCAPCHGKYDSGNNRGAIKRKWGHYATS